MKTPHSAFPLRFFIGTTILASILLFLPYRLWADDNIFSPDFSMGKLDDDWQSVPPDGNNAPPPTDYKLITAPGQLDDTKKVLSTPGGETRETYLWHTEKQAVSGRGDLLVSFILDADQGETYWTTNWALFTDTIKNGGYQVNGFGFNLSAKDASIYRSDGNTSGGKTTVLAKADLKIPVAAGWNKVSFRWAADGTLTVTLNGTDILSVPDTTYPPTFRVVRMANFLNNKAPVTPAPDGKVLLFDQIKVVWADPMVKLH